MKTFKEIFDKQILVEDVVGKIYNIYYKFDFNLKKKKEETDQQPQQNAQDIPPQSAAPEQQPQPESPITAVPPAPPENIGMPSPEQQAQEIDDSMKPAEPEQSAAEVALSSVYTEEEKEEKEGKEKKIKLSGDISLKKEKIDRFESIYEVIGAINDHYKGKHEEEIEFCTEFTQLLIDNNLDKISQDYDVLESTYFVEVVFGFNKQESVGVRYNKRKGMDKPSPIMLIDNNIIGGFSIKNINTKIQSFRNYSS